jgi:polar amino acid transport system substrate-binding protein
VLVRLHDKMRNNRLYEISPFPLNIKSYAVAMRKGEKNLQAAINDALIGMEASGDAERIYNRWFGPETSDPIPRGFSIQR